MRAGRNKSACAREARRFTARGRVESTSANRPNLRPAAGRDRPRCHSFPVHRLKAPFESHRSARVAGTLNPRPLGLTCGLSPGRFGSTRKPHRSTRLVSGVDSAEAPRLAHLGTVEQGAFGRVGADIVIRPAHEGDIGAEHLPLGQISRRLDVHCQVGKTGNPKTELTGDQARRLKIGGGTELAGNPFRIMSS